MAAPPRNLQIVRDKMAPWRQDIDQKHIETIARKLPFPREPLIEYYSESNLAVVKKVSESLGGGVLAFNENGNTPKKGSFPPSVKKIGNKGFDMAMVECPDARHHVLNLDLLLNYWIIHQRTAGSTVIHGHMFQTIKQGGFGIVAGHRNCGACKAAHDLESSPDAEVHYTIARIVDAIEAYVREIRDPEIRDRENVFKQAFVAERCLRLEGRNEMVYPAFFTWEEGKNAFEWLDRDMHAIQASRFYERLIKNPLIKLAYGLVDKNHPLKSSLNGAAETNIGYALAEGRDFSSQYAAISVLYDPYRLGPVNDVRVALGAIGNEMFAATMDLRCFDPLVNDGRHKKKVSRTAMGSSIYSAYDKHNGHYGHVSGVGGKDGTHLLGIFDRSEQVIENVTRHLVDNFPILDELTRGGRDIVKMLYDPTTVRMTVLKD